MLTPLNVLAILLVVLVVIPIIIILASIPRSAAIYFSGAVEDASFTLTSDRVVTYGLKHDNQYNGTVEFRFEETEIMYVVNASMSEEEIQQICREGYPGWETSNTVFPFNEGIATLFTMPLARIILEPPEDGSFTYDLEITRDKQDETVSQNQIELKNFPEDLVIKLSSTNDIDMNGSTTKKIPAGLYRIVGCNSITFYSVPLTHEDSEMGYNPQLNASLEHFRFTNSEQGAFETTYTAKLEHSDVGHVEVEGDASQEQRIKLEIGDIGQYPIPIEITGRAEQLKVAGKSCYPSVGQMLVDSAPQMLWMVIPAIAGAMFGVLFEKVLKDKPDKKTEAKGEDPPT